MQKLLTIVVPVYKVEQYINKCLDSCIIYKNDAQGQQIVDKDIMDRLEVIIVNDGTPDNSAELSREYTKRYPNTFRQIDKANGGHGSAWNVGLKEATGKYLRFLDSDDWLSNLDKLMEELSRTDADLVFTTYNKFYVQEDRYEPQVLSLPTKTVSPLDKNTFADQKIWIFTMNFWHTTYKTSILQPQWPLFEEKVMYDDTILVVAPLLYAKTYISYDFVLYNYLIGRVGQSMDPSIIAKNLDSHFKCYRRRVEWQENAVKQGLCQDFVELVASARHAYARRIFSLLPNLPYRSAKREMETFYKEGNLKQEPSKTPLEKRYDRFPFLIFYTTEYFRRNILLRFKSK